MPCRKPGCIRSYDFERIAYYARKRYVDGVETVALLCDAKSESERALIVLACMLDLSDEKIREFKLFCSRECQRKTFGLRDRLKKMVEHEKARKNTTEVDLDNPVC